MTISNMDFALIDAHLKRQRSLIASAVPAGQLSVMGHALTAFPKNRVGQIPQPNIVAMEQGVDRKKNA